MRLGLLLLALVFPAGVADAQKRCVKGIPCGNTCIAANKTCRIGSPSSTSSATSTNANAQTLLSAAAGTQRAIYVFVAKERPDGSKYIQAEPISSALPVLRDRSLLTLELSSSTSWAVASELADQLNRQVRNLSYVPPSQ